jgi:hypothetical protein
MYGLTVTVGIPSSAAALRILRNAARECLRI